MKFYKIILFAACFIGLILLQRDVINPLVVDIVGSDIFLVDTDDKGGIDAISTPMTNIAFMHCNNHIRHELDSELTINFPDKPINAWNIGNHEYVINAEIEFITNDTLPVFKKYVCRISYSKGNDELEAMNFDNWSIYGLSGLND